MFQLIVAVVSIALVAILGLASTYYGGTAFTLSKHKGYVTALINSGEEIAAANALYISDWGASAASLSALTNNGTYLASLPINSVTLASTWFTNGTNVWVLLTYTGAPLVNFCKAISAQAGVTTAFLAPSGDLPAGYQFGCIGSPTLGTAAFHFRL